MPLVEPLDAMFADFGVPALVGGRSVTVILDTAPVSELGVQSDNPLMTIMHADMAGVARGDAITVDGQPYVVARIEPDGTGGIDTVELERA